ncbi:MAG: hypothetical protein CM1200mP10_05920 [Candidatus Neomarinimicrobiota bacterium]|nr:MAG: hypothetical protein CM1200mP10_05920 [Candidatus Neomarinimicrobiota bacterium]
MRGFSSDVYQCTSGASSSGYRGCRIELRNYICQSMNISATTVKKTLPFFSDPLKVLKKESAECQHCGSSSLERLISKPGRIQSKGKTEGSGLRAVDPRKTVENMSRQYDNAGIDPGEKGFNEVAKQAAAGKSPETLKEVIKEARKNESNEPSSSKKGKDKK